MKQPARLCVVYNNHKEIALENQSFSVSELLCASSGFRVFDKEKL